jgi:UDP-N-acetylmuramate dehydrogenase
MSRFKAEDAGRFAICEVTFRLRAGARPTVTYPDIIEHLSNHGVASPQVRAVREAVLDVRRRKGMVIDAADPDTRSVGSFFMNPVVNREAYERIALSCRSGADARVPRIPHYVMDNGTVKIPAAWLIEQSGFARGHVDGAVGLSTKHPLAIINRGGATARDVIRLARRIKAAVAERFGVVLRPEPVFVGFRDNPDVEYLRA